MDCIELTEMDIARTNGRRSAAGALGRPTRTPMCTFYFVIF